MVDNDYQKQRSEWQKKGWVIPDIKGSKNIWFNIVVETVNHIRTHEACGVDDIINVAGVVDSQALRKYYPFLSRAGLIRKENNLIQLTEEGVSFQNNPSRISLAIQMHNKFRLFGETLGLLAEKSMTVAETNDKISELYDLDWRSVNNTRKRMDWLEALELIQPIGNNKWEITNNGREVLKNWTLVTPDAIKSIESDNTEDVEIADAPEEISLLLQRLNENPELHNKRSTYRIWVPGSTRIKNLFKIVQFADNRAPRKELFDYIEKEFGVKASSIESMMPFLKVSGLIEEVGRNIYVSTPVAKAWIETGNDIDFIRILHSSMRFVGEMIRAAKNDIARNTLYEQAKRYGLTTDKARWIAGFLLEAGLLEEPKHLHLKATSLGKTFIVDLPMKEEGETIDKTEDDIYQEIEIGIGQNTYILKGIIDHLIHAATDPAAENKAPGVAFEEEIAQLFCEIGFEAKRVGGAGDTDVIVKWKDLEGKNHITIIDAKSKSNGSVSHGDISDVAKETHKEKNNADYVAIVGPAFSGDTIRNHAKKKGFALITAEELGDLAISAQKLGLSLDEIALLFRTPNGLSQLSEIIAEKQRELDIITTVVAKMQMEQEELGGLSPRDMSLLLRDNNLSPTREELRNIFEFLSKPEIGVLQADNKKTVTENTLYKLTGGKNTVYRLHAVADAIEKGYPNKKRTYYLTR